MNIKASALFLSSILLTAGLLTSDAGAQSPTPSTFIPTGSMSTPRAEHTATLLPNGKVLVTGGSASTTSQATAELYDPSTGQFTSAGNMNTPRGRHTAMLLANGKVLIAGGDSGATLGSTSAELYDPSSGTFILTGSMVTGRSGHTATLLPNGNVLIAGGFTSSGTTAVAELYNPNTGAFTSTGTMNVPRFWHTATLLPSGKALIAGGANQASAELYDPSTGIFTLLANSMSVPRTLHAATLLPNGKVLIAGGDQNLCCTGNVLSTAELFDPATNTFASTGSMTAPRFIHTATLLSNGQVLVAGGDGNTILVNDSAELYDPVTSLFASTGSMSVARDRHTATLLSNGNVLVTGGSNGITFLASAELYTPASGTREFPIFTGHSAEPSLAVDPGDPFHAVVGFNDFSGSADPITGQACGWAETHTSGLNWSPGSLVFPKGFHPVGDPWVRYGPNRELYYSCVGRTDISIPGIGVKFFTIGIFVGVSKTGLASDLGTASPITTALLTCPTNLIAALLPVGCNIIDAGGQFDDRPSISLLSLPNGANRIVACWTDFFSLSGNRSSFVNAAYSDDGVVWSRTTLGKGANCTVGRNGLWAAVTWFNDNDQTLSIRTSNDGISWNPAFILANVAPLVQGIESNGQIFFSTTSLVLSEPYGIVIPDGTGLKVVWQSGGSTSRVLVGDAVVNAAGQVFTDPNNAVLPTASTFLPGPGSCGLIAGAYQLTTSAGQFRYKVWPLTGAGPVKPIFISGVDLDRQKADQDKTFPGFPRIGDYTSTDCSGQMGWAAWTDLRGGQSAIYGAVIPLAP